MTHQQRAVRRDYPLSLPVSPRAPRPSTTSAATATNTIDNATAALASVTRCR